MPGILAEAIAAACKIVIFQCTVGSFLDSQGVKDLDVVEIFTISKSVARAAENHGMRSETLTMLMLSMLTSLLPKVFTRRSNWYCACVGGWFWLRIVHPLALRHAVARRGPRTTLLGMPKIPMFRSPISWHASHSSCLCWPGLWTLKSSLRTPLAQ